MRKVLLVISLLLATALTGPAHADDALYASLGERPGIQRIVDALAVLWLDDARIKDDFDNINMEHLKLRLVDQLCEVSGGPCHYKGRPMGPSHKGLHINQAKFDAVVEDLQTAMDQVGIPFRVQNRLVARLAPMERDIVTR
jgi:hemoglobin